MSVVVRNNVNVFGNGTRHIVFAHGYGCDQNMWRFITPFFIDDYQVTLFDHVGSGQSDIRAYDRERYASLDGYADDLLEICNELNIEGAVFVGHSVSAMIGVLADIKEPHHFTELVLVGPSPRYINDGDYVGGFTEEDIRALLEFQDRNYLGWSHWLAPIIMGNDDRPKLAHELAQSFCSTDPEIAKHFAAVTFLSDNRADLKHVQARSLIIQTREDAIAPLQVGKYVRSQIPDSVLTVIDATGHCPHLSAPIETRDAILAFLG